MSSQINSSVYNEKKIAAYESLFKESALAKPQEVYLTVTVAHLFGQAYIMEQQGTKEGDPVYSRFVCPLEDITKVYINNNVKASPLFIQCDTDVKGVLHRKRIIVPCLENVAAIVDQIKEVQAHHMEKYEAAQEREKQKKREFLEAARLAEQLENQAKTKKAHTDIPDDLPRPKLVKPMSAQAAQALSSGVEESFKALEAISRQPEKSEAKLVELPKPIPHPVKDEFPEIDDDLPAAEIAAEASADIDEKVPETAPADVTEDIGSDVSADSAEEAVTDVADDIPADTAKEEAKADAAEEIPETVPNNISVSAPVNSSADIPASAPVNVNIPVQEEKAPSIAKVTPRPVTTRVNPSGNAIALNDFETEVRKLKEQLDSQQISRDEYAAEKKKLLANLY